MKKVKNLLGFLTFACLTMLNFTHSEQVSFLQSLASSSSKSFNTSSKSSSSSSSSSGSSSSSTNPCCKEGFFAPDCNQKKCVSEVNVNCKIISTTYFLQNGEARVEVVKYGVVVNSVSAEFKAKSVRQTVSESGMEFKSEVVTCPTSGSCNNCDEYRPSCEE